METAAFLVLLLAAIANVLAYVRGGPAGVRHWWRMKLVGS